MADLVSLLTWIFDQTKCSTQSLNLITDVHIVTGRSLWISYSFTSMPWQHAHAFEALCSLCLLHTSSHFTLTTTWHGQCYSFLLHIRKWMPRDAMQSAQGHMSNWQSWIQTQRLLTLEPSIWITTFRVKWIPMERSHLFSLPVNVKTVSPLVRALLTLHNSCMSLSNLDLGSVGEAEVTSRNMNGFYLIDVAAADEPIPDVVRLASTGPLFFSRVVADGKLTTAAISLVRFPRDGGLESGQEVCWLCQWSQSTLVLRFIFYLLSDRFAISALSLTLPSNPLQL